MKKIFFLLALVVMMFSACSEGTDFDIDYTPIAPIGGQYALNIEKGYDPSKTDAEYWDSNPSDVEEICKVSDGVFGFLSNTTDYDKDKAWIRIGNYSTATEWAINAKVSINMNDYIESKFPEAYMTAKKVCDMLGKSIGKELDEMEIGYLAMHIERIYSEEIKA